MIDDCQILSLVSDKLPEDQKETTPNEYDSCEIKRRLFYKTAFYFPPIKANELSLYFQGLSRTDILLIQYLIRTSSQKVIKTIDGTKQVLKDISEAKWQWRAKMAEAISEGLQSPLTGKAIERSEDKLIAKGLLIKRSFSNGDGTTMRYIAFSRHFMAIAKGMAAPQKVPELSNDIPKPVMASLESVLDKMLSPLPAQFKVLATKPYAKNYFHILVLKNNKRVDLNGIELVDIAEAKWNSQGSLAKQWGVSIETIKQVERALKQAKVLEIKTNGLAGGACRRYFAFSKSFQRWLLPKVIEEKF